MPWCGRAAACLLGGSSLAKAEGGSLNKGAAALGMGGIGVMGVLS
jgi:hypothetical protein